MDSENAALDQFSDVPEGHHAFAVLDQTGDTKTMWDPTSEDEIENARLQFERLVSTKRYSAFCVDAKDPNKKGKRMTEFDPDAGRVIFVPPMQGG